MTVVFLALISVRAHATVPATLKGSPASMQRQNRVAKQQGYVFVRSSEEILELVEEGVLVKLTGNQDYAVKRSVSYPYARPEMRLFIERLAQQYHEGTGEKLVVTSLTRPQSRQPRNAHSLSVHPTGIAVDLRVSSRRASRAWLESVLLKLERKGLLDVTRERWPPHYHIALFPEAYRTHVEAMTGPEVVAALLAGEPLEEQAEEPAAEELVKEAVTTVDAEKATETREEPSSGLSLLVLGVMVGVAAALVHHRRRRSADGIPCHLEGELEPSV